MSVDLIGATANTAQSANLQTSTLSQQDFLKVLLTQLQFQDPLKPLDNEAFLAQMAQFSSLAQTAETNTKIDTLLSVQAAAQSIGLIGKTVQLNTATGSQIGTVGSLTFDSNGVPSLSVTTAGGAALTGISVSQISVVR